MSRVFYWGCWGRAGHFLWNPQRQTLRDFESERDLLPKGYHLDASGLFLPHPERKGQGALTFLPALNLTILAWWGSPWDQRGAVNSAVLVRGKLSMQEVWTAFAASFPDLVGQLQPPQVVLAP